MIHAPFILCVLVVLCWCFFMVEGTSGVSSFLGSALLVMSMLFFLSKEPLMFFLWMEGVSYTIVMYLLFYGYQVEKVTSSWYLMLFSFLSSMIFLGTLLSGALTGTASGIICFSTLLVFFVKLPLFFFHSWLPKVHVESATLGSVTLASVLLKLGCWGFYVFYSSVSLAGVLFTATFLGTTISSLLCLFQSDGKSLVAFSSVVHMSVFVLFLLTGSLWGWKGSLLMLFSHGVVSGVLFLSMGVLYSGTQSRELVRHGGLMKNSLWLCLMVFFFFLLNGGLAPFFSFSSELLGLSSIFLYEKWAGAALAFYFMFSFFYCIYYGTQIYLGKEGQKQSFMMSGAFMMMFVLPGAISLL